MTFRTASFGVLVVCGLAACGGGSDPSAAAGAELGRASQSIFGGELDTEHPEVMLLFDQAGSVCTGTNIRSEDGSGFLLTAAHCVTDLLPGGGITLVQPDQLLVVPGEDFILSPVAFPATGVAVEPNYTGGFAEDDIAIVSFFTGDEPPPPAIEPLSAADDTLDVANELVLIGYGDTELGGINTERRQVSRDVAGLDDELIVYSQQDGSGACFGDSGGPGLASVGGQERVAGIISGGVEDAGEAPCESGLGVSMRVSAYEDFIAAALAVLAP
jgi:secreted trypsin-like serine protease